MGSIIKSISVFISKVFLPRKKSNAVGPEVSKAGTPTVEVSKAPGLDCPQCGHRIQITIPTLLSGRPFYCTNCFLEISVDREKSNEALGELSKLNNAMQKAESIKNQLTY